MSSTETVFLSPCWVSNQFQGWLWHRWTLWCKIQSMESGKSFQKIGSPTTKVGNGVPERPSTAEPKKSPPSMPFWFLHPPDCHHGSCCKNYLPQQVHPCNRNRLQVGLPSRASSLVDSPLNLHPTLQQQYCNHWATSHFWRRTMSVWMGNNVRNNLQLNKWIK